MRGVKLLLLIVFAGSFFSVWGENSYLLKKSLDISSAYYFPDHDGYKLGGDFAPITYSPVTAEGTNQRDLGTTWGGAELIGYYNMDLTKDFLSGGTALTKDNNIKHRFSLGLSPVDINFGVKTTVTPIAFLTFSASGKVASGWKAIGVDGLALYTDPDGANSSAFQGIYTQLGLNGTFQFDLAAILGGDTTWKHIVLLSSHNLFYNNFSAAGSNDPWIYEGKFPQYNGFKYEHSSFLGYRMPLVLAMTGFLFETEANLFDNATRSEISDGGWGSDYLTIKLGILFNLKLNEKNSLTILPQIKRNLRYTDSTVSQSYFINRVANKDNPYYWDFWRVALSYNYKF